MSWSVSSGAFLHDSAAYGLKAEAALSAELDDFSLGAMVSDYSGALDVSWNYKYESFRSTVGTSVNGYYRNGGVWTLYSDLGQDFRLWNRLSFSYRAGVQVGLSWSPFAPKSLPFSLSPYGKIAIGYDDDTYRCMFYFHSMREFEHTFQAPPILGIELGWNINENHGIGIDAYMKLADYLNGADLVISDMAMRVFYTYRGGRA